MPPRYQQTLEYFSEGFNCAQAVVASYTDYSGLSRQDSLRVAAGFGGGIAGMQKTCGAITGAIIVLGSSLYNPDNPGVSTDIIKQYGQTLTRLLEKKFGTSSCLGIINKEKEMLSRNNNVQKRGQTCLEVLKDTCTILDEMLKSQNPGKIE